MLPCLRSRRRRSRRAGDSPTGAVGAPEPVKSRQRALRTRGPIFPSLSQPPSAVLNVADSPRRALRTRGLIIPSPPQSPSTAPNAPRPSDEQRRLRRPANTCRNHRSGVFWPHESDADPGRRRDGPLGTGSPEEWTEPPRARQPSPASYPEAAWLDGRPRVGVGYPHSDQGGEVGRTYLARFS